MLSTADHQGPLRVLRVIARLNVGGPAIHATLLTERLDRAQFETKLVAGVPEPGEADYLALLGRRPPELVEVLTLGRELGPRDAAALRALVRIIREFRPHVVHTHTAKAGTLGRLAAQLCGVPRVVHTFHGHVLRGYFSPTRERVFRAIERGLARITDRLVAVSPTVRDELLALGVGRPEQYRVVPLGFDLDAFAGAEARRGTLRAEIDVGARPLVGIVARLVPIKAHDVFLQVAARVRALDPRVHFVIVGDGPCRPALEAEVVRARLGNCTHFLGWRGDLDRIYADLDVVVLTSRNEGSPVALIEAMASGCPVVSTRVGGVADVVEDGVTGRLVAVDDVDGLAAATLALLADPAARATMGREARARALARYGAHRLVADVTELYRELFTLGGRP